MDRSPHNQRPLFPSWCDWHELPDDVCQRVLNVLIALYLEIVDPPNSEPETNDSPQH